MIVFDDGFAQIHWNGESTFNVVIYNRNVDCFQVYGVECQEQAIFEAQDHMQYFYESID